MNRRVSGCGCGGRRAAEADEGGLQGLCYNLWLHISCGVVEVRNISPCRDVVTVLEREWV